MFEWIYDLKRAAQEVDIPAIIERKSLRLMAGLDPEFTIDLDKKAYPAVWKWMESDSSKTICGCPVRWHHSRELTP